MQINGKAHVSYAGKIIQLYTATDYVTNQKQKESHDTIDSDGYFELSIHTEIIQPVFLKIENVSAQLYIQPDYVYGITIPELDETKNVNKEVDLQVNIGIIGNDSTELNMLINDYQDTYNKVIASDNSFPARNVMFKRADSLQKLSDKKYASVKNTYFKSYIRYSVASLNVSLSRGQKYLMHTYIIGKPIQYNHNEYMQFFNACFHGYLDRIASQRKGQSLYNIINGKADYPALMNFVRYEQALNSDSLRELIIISNLWDSYFSPDFSSEAIENIITQINLQTKNKEHKKITSTMLAYFKKLPIGSQAPDFTAIAKDKKNIKLSVYKGRWIYLNFFSTKNIESLKEMPKIAALRKKFGDKVVFVSICLDDSISAYRDYIRQNPKLDWAIWYGNPKSLTASAKEAYGVTGTEAYFLINNFGYLAQSPAISPSRGIEYKLNVLFKVRQKNTKTGFR